MHHSKNLMLSCFLLWLCNHLTVFFSDFMLECECDIGGAYNNVCNKTSGQCECKGNIDQRQCDRLIV